MSAEVIKFKWGNQSQIMRHCNHCDKCNVNVILEKIVLELIWLYNTSCTVNKIWAAKIYYYTEADFSILEIVILELFFLYPNVIVLWPTINGLKLRMLSKWLQCPHLNLTASAERGLNACHLLHRNIQRDKWTEKCIYFFLVIFGDYSLSLGE